ncbi:hypothetical protein BCR33DRAFT_742675 [Rhizoclosmatium globosum]|uniref:Uncharacterized protein n=1 Tax=Rhizoclosmatium globosum TaxID=329046 RepID=A0A1Y2BPR6_9FUNG|nr:hypothetical protein BCR33DRAFT_742675 [Rhizoclosmatium globosum]|eukprot:ORY36730.1 hypothetical protein BCR33DRAFT_742675 [Rhizoclosmatium globosum]
MHEKPVNLNIHVLPSSLSRISTKYASFKNSIDSSIYNEEALLSKRAAIKSMQSKVCQFESCLKNIDNQVVAITSDLKKAENVEFPAILLSFLSKLVSLVTKKRCNVFFLQLMLSHFQDSRFQVQESILNIDLEISKLVEEQRPLAKSVIKLNDQRGQLKNLLDTTFKVNNLVLETEEHIFWRDLVKRKIADQIQKQLVEASWNAEEMRNSFERTKQLLVASDEHLHFALNYWGLAYEGCIRNDISARQKESKKAVEEISTSVTLLIAAKKIDKTLPSWMTLGLVHFEVLHTGKYLYEYALDHCAESEATIHFARQKIQVHIERLSALLTGAEISCKKVLDQKMVARRDLYTFRIVVMEKGLENGGKVEVSNLLPDFMLE